MFLALKACVNTVLHDPSYHGSLHLCLFPRYRSTGPEQACGQLFGEGRSVCSTGIHRLSLGRKMLNFGEISEASELRRANHSLPAPAP